MRNFYQSLGFSLDYIKRIIENGDMDIAVESLLQLVKDLYYYRFQCYPRESIREAIREMGLDYGDEEITLLEDTEQQSRRAEHYFEFIATVKPAIVRSVRDKAEIYFQSNQN